MRIPLITAAFAGSLAACAPSHTVFNDRGSQQQRPITARLEGPSAGGGNIAFWVNQPAYVAIFEIVPGQGASLLYPTRGYSQQRVSGGAMSVHMPLNVRGRDYYEQTRVSRAMSRPGYLYMIASRRPLQIRDLAERPSALRLQLGYNTFTSYSPWTVMDAIADLVVPFSEYEEDWVADMWTAWDWQPSRAYGSRWGAYTSSYGSYYDDYYSSSGRRLVRCYSGQTMWVPWDYPYAGCPHEGYAPRPPVTSPPSPADTTTPRTPPDRGPSNADSIGPRRPVEAEADGRTPRRYVEEAERPRVIRGERGDQREAERVRRNVIEDERNAAPVRNSEPRRNVAPSEPPRTETPRSREPARAEPRTERRAEPRPEPRSEPRAEPRAEPRSERPRRAEPSRAPEHQERRPEREVERRPPTP